MRRWPPSWPTTPVSCCSQVRDEVGFWDPYDLGDAGDKRANSADPGRPCAQTPRRRGAVRGGCRRPIAGARRPGVDRRPAGRDPGILQPAATTGPCTSRCGSATEPRGRRPDGLKVPSPTPRSRCRPSARCTARDTVRPPRAPRRPARSGSPPAPTGRLLCCGGCATCWTSSSSASARRVRRRWRWCAATSTPTCTPAGSGSGTRPPPRAWCAPPGLHASRLDGSPLIYNRRDPYLPDLLMCRAELADQLLTGIRSVVRGRPDRTP